MTSTGHTSSVHAARSPEGGHETLVEALRSRKVLGTLFFSATLVAINWFVFIWAVTTGQVLQASLGYFITPMANVLLGVIFLRERLRPWQMLAVLMAATGTLTLTLNYGRLPWISLTLAFSFGFYGLLRKTVQIESINGLFVALGSVAVEEPADQLSVN